MPVTEEHSFRPSGRLLLTIGRDLVQEPSAAILELVKNAYDADSPNVELTIRAEKDDAVTIIIEDHGHGMSRETVLGTWLVPSTPDKKKRRQSPGGRTLQGRKGVGRFAASMLGSELDMETVSKAGERTCIHVNWNTIARANYLDEVRIPVRTDQATSPPGTKMTIHGRGEYRNAWNAEQINRLKRELKKLMPPAAPRSSEEQEESEFSILLTVQGFGESDFQGPMEPFPVFELYDYRISGIVESDGRGKLVFHQKIHPKNKVEEHISFTSKNEHSCGRIEVDIRVFDRETSAISRIITRGLKDENGNYLGKLETKNLLNASCGIGVYRNGFRIRPLGDPAYDWLELDTQRVQNPSMRIGSNQVIGIVRIQTEEQSGLIEKSARDGLKENDACETLKHITKQIIRELESRRYALRKQLGSSRKNVPIEETLEKLQTLRDVRETLQKRLKQEGVAPEAVAAVMEDMNAIEQEKNHEAEQIQKTLSIYGAQATLGKLVTAILHEARRPVSTMNNNASTIENWHQLYLRNSDAEIITKDMLPLITLFPGECRKLSGLFRRLDPLASGRRENRKHLALGERMRHLRNLHAHSMQETRVELELDGESTIQLYGWEQDVDALFGNLIDNSLYWMIEGKSERKRIRIAWKADKNGKLKTIDYTDSGPGIDEALIDSGNIFDPGFSMKPDGTGLGLAIARETAHRLGLELTALPHDSGAWFHLEPIGAHQNQKNA